MPTDISGALRKLNRVQTRAGSIPWYLIGQLLDISVKTNFVVGGRFGSGPLGGGAKRWAPRKKKYSHRLMIKSGTLMNNNRIRVVKHGVQLVNSGLDYNRAQNDGYSPRGLPARNFMVGQDQDIENIKKIIKAYIVR